MSRSHGRGGARLRRHATVVLLALVALLLQATPASAASTIVSFTADPSYVRVPERATLTAMANENLYSMGKSIRIVDLKTGNALSTCSSQTCSAYAQSSWADNADAVEKRYRAEIINGTTVEHSMELTLPVRRYVFHLKPSVLEKSTSYYGEVRYLTEVKASRTVSGTGLLIVVRNAATGQTVSTCSSDNSCGVMGYVGKTYRATVETWGGQVQGPAAVWTYTANGLRDENIDGLDLVRLAAQFVSPSAVCDRVLLAPGQTYLTQPPSTMSDQYRACVTAVQAGKGTLEVLRAVADADGDGDDSLIWWLDGDRRRPVPAAGTGDAGDSTAPPSTPDKIWIERNLADELMAKNGTLTQYQADKVAAQCVWLTARNAMKANTVCAALPIFASGSDVAEATDHDLIAIAKQPSWVRLNYLHHTEQSGSRGWYKPALCEPEPDRNLDCDEYPFWSSEQGGPNASPPVHLLKIDSDDNQYQGSRYGTFIGKCNMSSLLQKRAADPGTTATRGDAFLSIPVPAEFGVPTKVDICNGKT